MTEIRTTYSAFSFPYHSLSNLGSITVVYFTIAHGSHTAEQNPGETEVVERGRDGEGVSDVALSLGNHQKGSWKKPSLRVYSSDWMSHLNR